MPDADTVNRMLLSNSWDMGAAIQAIEPGMIEEAMRFYAKPPSLMAVEPELDGPKAQELRKWLKPIGMKSWPNWAPEARTEWLSATMLALSNLPPDIATRAAKEAIHFTYRFPADAESKIREIAAEMLDRYDRALFRLRRMREEIQRAADASKQIPHMPTLWTQEMVDDANATFSKLGLETRYRLSDTKPGEVESYQIEQPKRG